MRGNRPGLLPARGDAAAAANDVRFLAPAVEPVDLGGATLWEAMKTVAWVLLILVVIGCVAFLLAWLGP